MKKIYLDHAAATPMSGQVLKAMEPYFAENFYNASATYLAGRQVRAELNGFRAEAAQVFGCRPGEIIFTSGATEANNLALGGIKKAYPEGQLIVSAVEHESVLGPAQELGAKTIPVDKNGRVLIDELSKMLDQSSVLISVMLVNNETGTLQPIKEITELVSNIRKSRQASGNDLPLYLHTDAAQAANYMDLHVSRLGVDLMSVNGGKIYGPKGIGLLYVKAGVKLQPLTTGGGQEFGLRSGTENLAAIAGLLTALRVAQQTHEMTAQTTADLRSRFESLVGQSLPGASVNGAKHRAPHISSITFEGQDNETLMMRLDEAGVMCAVGSACSASSDEPSHVLKAMGLSDEEARSTLRFSFGALNTVTQVEEAADKLRTLLDS